MLLQFHLHEVPGAGTCRDRREIGGVWARGRGRGYLVGTEFLFDVRQKFRK